MNRIEDRLRDAFAAAAETVRPESVAGLPDPSRLARPRRAAALAAAAAVAVVIIGASITTPLLLAGGHAAPAGPAGPPASPAAPASPSTAAVTIVPNVVGMTVNEALAVLQSAGLRVVIVNQSGSAVPAGTVMSETPAAGTGLVSGATITLTAAAGPRSSSGPAQGATG